MSGAACKLERLMVAICRDATRITWLINAGEASDKELCDKQREIARCAESIGAALDAVSEILSKIGP